jgi:hypothetical protein
MKQYKAPASAEAASATGNQKRSQADSESAAVNMDLDSVDDNDTAPEEKKLPGEEEQSIPVRLVMPFDDLDLTLIAESATPVNVIAAFRRAGIVLRWDKHTKALRCFIDRGQAAEVRHSYQSKKRIHSQQFPAPDRESGSEIASPIHYSDFRAT